MTALVTTSSTSLNAGVTDPLYTPMVESDQRDCCSLLLLPFPALMALAGRPIVFEVSCEPDRLDGAGLLVPGLSIQLFVTNCHVLPGVFLRPRLMISCGLPVGLLDDLGTFFLGRSLPHHIDFEVQSRPR